MHLDLNVVSAVVVEDNIAAVVVAVEQVDPIVDQEVAELLDSDSEIEEVVAEDNDLTLVVDRHLVAQQIFAALIAEGSFGNLVVL